MTLLPLILSLTLLAQNASTPSLDEIKMDYKVRRKEKLYRPHEFSVVSEIDTQHNATLIKYAPIYLTNLTPFSINLDNTPIIKTKFHLNQLQIQPFGKFLGLANKNISTLQIFSPDARQLIFEQPLRTLRLKSVAFFNTENKRYRITIEISSAPIYVARSNPQDPNLPLDWRKSPVYIISIEEYY